MGNCVSTVMREHNRFDYLDSLYASFDKGSNTFMTDNQIPVTRSDLMRLETKVDQLATAINSLIRIEERQLNQAERLRTLETDFTAYRKECQAKQEILENVLETKTDALKSAHDKLDRSVDRWIARGTTVWVIVSLLISAFVTFRTAFPKGF